jgi:UDP-N-acetylmuramate dehydrogenase
MPQNIVSEGITELWFRMAKGRNTIEIKQGMLFKDLSTIRTGGTAEYFSCPKSSDQLNDVISWEKRKALGVFVLGNGSNIVISDKGLPGLTLSLKPHLANFRLDGRVLTVKAGAMWPIMAVKMAKRGLRGLEAGLGIPGTIGGAVYIECRDS